MEAIKKLASAYLVGISTVVAVFFIINIFLVDAISVLAVWHVLDVLMLVGLALGMGFNYAHKIRVGGREAGDQVSRGHLKANVAFYTTTVITILFLPTGSGSWSPATSARATTTRPGHLGGGGHCSAHRVGRHRLPPLAGDLQRMTRAEG
jgi:hypothetical protein